MNIFQKITSALLLLSVISCTTAELQKTTGNLDALSPYGFEQRHVVAVFPFTFKGEQQEYRSLSDKLSDLAASELFHTKRFRVVERGRLDAVLQEVSLSQTGVIEETDMHRLGKQLGAELLMVGTLTAIKPIKMRDSIGIAWRETRGYEVSLQGRLIDISRGEMIAVAKATGMEAQQEKMAVGANTGAIASDETLLNMAMETAVKILVHNLAKDAPPKKIQK